MEHESIPRCLHQPSATAFTASVIRSLVCALALSFGADALAQKRDSCEVEGVKSEQARHDRVRACGPLGLSRSDACRDAKEREQEQCNREKQACKTEGVAVKCNAPEKSIVVVGGKRRFKWAQ